MKDFKEFRNTIRSEDFLKKLMQQVQSEMPKVNVPLELVPLMDDLITASAKVSFDIAEKIIWQYHDWLNQENQEENQV